MLYDKLASFGTNIDPGALVANTVRYVGDTVFMNPGYAHYPSGKYNLPIVGAQELYVHFEVTTTFSTNASKTVHFRIMGGNAVNSSGDLIGASRRTLATGSVVNVTSSANGMTAGANFLLTIPVNPETRFNYLQTALVSNQAVADEAGRYTAWLSVSAPRKRTNEFIQEPRGWY